MARARQETDLYTMEYDEEIDAVVFTWEEFSTGERFRSGADDLLEFIREQDARKLIVHTAGIKAHNDDDERWLQEEWIPRMVEAGIEYSANVHRESVISEMDMEEFVQEIEDMGFTTMMTDDITEAREWIAEK